MPLYEYYCALCNRYEMEMRLIVEREQKPLPKCGQCGDETKPVISPVRGVVKNPAVPRRSK